jgi:integrase
VQRHLSCAIVRPANLLRTGADQRAGVSPKIVSERLGHASVGFTLDVYAHAVPGWQAAAAVAGLVFGQRS